MMAGKGMGAATRGGGCVGSGSKGKVVSKMENTTGPVLLKKGGMAVKGKKVKKYRKGGMCD
jgi:hypothetical protein